jgi:hypothetical protein
MRLKHHPVMVLRIEMVKPVSLYRNIKTKELYPLKYLEKENDFAYAQRRYKTN